MVRREYRTDPDAPKESTLLERHDKNEQVREQLEAARAGKEASEETPESSDKPILSEREAIEFKVPNGKLVEMSDPGRSTAFLLASMYKGKSEDLTSGLALALLYVTKIDGKAVPSIRSFDQVRELADVLGDRGSRLVAEMYHKHFNVNAEDVSVIKKNL